MSKSGWLQMGPWAFGIGVNTQLDQYLVGIQVVVKHTTFRGGLYVHLFFLWLGIARV